MAFADEAAATGGKLRVYIGTYTGEESKGVYRGQLDLADGSLSAVELAAATPSPSFLALHPNGRFLYAVGEIDNFDGGKTGSVSGFAIDRATGDLKALNQQPSRGGAPCHLAVDPTGRFVLVANYVGGNVAALPIDADGSVKPAPDAGFVQHQGSSVNHQRQEAAHAHWIGFDPAGRFVLAADLGLDQVLVYRFDPARGSLAPNKPAFAAVAPGSGPRHVAFHPSGRFAYVINEMASTVTAFGYDGKQGSLAEIQTVSTLPADFHDENSTAEVQMHPSGRFLYGSNRGHDSLAMFAIDDRTGRLTSVGQQSTGGKTPRNFSIEPSGRYLIVANQSSNSLVVFRIDAASGKLTAVGQPVRAPSPVCVTFVPAEAASAAGKK